MVRKILAIVAVLCGLSLPVIGAQQADAAEYDIFINGTRYHCIDYYDRWGHTFPDGTPFKDMDLYVQITVAYRRCYSGSGNPFIQPNYSVLAYDRHGGTMSCNALWRYWDGASVNLYFWSPQRGTNFNPPKYSVGCSEDTTNSKMQNYDYADVPRLWYGPDPGSDAQPRWKAVLYGNRNGNSDLDATHYQDFEPN